MVGHGLLRTIVGGQFGSEAKGAVAAHLGRDLEDGLAVRVNGPNAGHCAVDDHGVKWALRCIPVAAVTNPQANLAIAAGSEVDLEVLVGEIEALEAGGHKIRWRLTIDPAATILTRDHIQQEQMRGINSRNGSTAKGIGAARSDRVWRTAQTVRDRASDFDGLAEVGDVASAARDVLRAGGKVDLEGSQGYGLGLHTQYYPYTTSADCRAIDVMAAAGISPWASYVDWKRMQIWVVFRTFPIRVAGNSGPLRNETSWTELNLPEEQTTVTRRTRRVGGWDSGLAGAAVRANGGPSRHVHVALTMIDHMDGEAAGVTNYDLLPPPARHWIAKVQGDLATGIELIGTSDRTMIDLRRQAK